MKTILIAIPTNRYIEPETMKSIYDLEIPQGYKTELQFFHGYCVDQVRNLVGHWAERYDYLFAVDSDIAFKPDTLKKLLSHNKDVVSGLYIQRKLGQHILELYRNGRNIPYGDIKGLGLIEVDSCGFGCVLVKSEVFKKIGYPYFVYKSAIDHKDTISEDTYFCLKAKQYGFKVFADTSILCEHIGSTKFIVDEQPIQSEFDRLLELSNTRLLPSKHINYLHAMKASGVEPKVIYDIGACVLHWTREAINVWPNAKFIPFEAMSECAKIYEHFNIHPYVIGVLSDKTGREVTFYQNVTHPGGNSYYKENEEINSNATTYFKDTAAVVCKTHSLDDIIRERKLPAPDMIKMDVQGAELDILKGATKSLETCTDVILELQKIEYNKGAPLREVVIGYMKERGFELQNDGPFCDNGPDGDYHFKRV